jgi:hypothetical protein
MRSRCSLMLLLIVIAPPGITQQGAPAIPDVPTLLHSVEAHQLQLEKTRENYTYLERTVITELNKDGSTKKTDTEEDEVFYVNTHEIDRKVKKNGKELSGSDQDKETKRVTKEVEKAQNTPPGQPENGDTISVGRMLQIMKYSAAYREMVDSRSTIVFDYTGDPHADTHGRAENASKKLAGTVWIDERDLQVRRLTARFDGDFHMGFGLLTLVKGSSFTFEQKLVNNELWLPVSAHVHAVAKAIGLLSYRAEIQVEDSNYQRFHAEAEPQSSATGAVKPPAP